MKKSIMFDVLNVIDSVHKKDSLNNSIKEHSLLKIDTFDEYNYIFQLAHKYDDSIAAILYVPECQSSENYYTPLYKGLVFGKKLDFSSFEDLINFIQSLDRKIGSEYIMKQCLYMEKKIIPDDFISYMLHTKDMKSISLLNETKLPEKIKFSLITLIFNYKEFLNNLVAYLTKIYEEIDKLYNKCKEIYRYTSRLLKGYLTSNNIENLLLIDVQEKLMNREMPKKYIVILSMLRLEYSLIINNGDNTVFVMGLFYIQRTLQDINFKIF